MIAVSDVRARQRAVLFCGAAMLSLAATAASAQTGSSADGAGGASDEIVVTGTLIRGIAPAGSNVIGVNRDQIEATGASTTNELLSKIPQVSNYFNALPQPGGASPGSNSVSTINRPNLRNLPGGATSGSALTLVLIDGHRVVGAGIGTVAVDPDAIPPGALERVEAITDGGSAVYGSDAMGGVINFITRKRFDGVRVGAHYGFANDYQTWDANVIAGKDWGSGSLYAAYAYSEHDAIFGKDRDYVRNVDWNPASLTYLQGQERSCAQPNVSVSGRNYPRPGTAFSLTPNTCDNTDYFTIYPANRQHHVFASLTQQLNDAISIDIKAFYTYRKDEANGGPLRGSVTMRSGLSGNPNYESVTPATGFPGDATANQTVSFDYAPVFGNYALTNDTILKTWNVTPSLTADLGGRGNWQLRALFNYGESRTIYDNIDLFAANQTVAAASTDPATALDPYDIATTPAAVLAGLRGRNLGIGKHRFTDFRVVVDGALLALPGGDVRIAVGGERMNSHYSQQKTDTTNYTLPAPVEYGQTVTSAFGEVQIPIFGDENGFGGMRRLNFSASGRYDRYSDFGSTFNPKLAVTWRPVEWIEFTGNWGKSFSAPSPSDQLGPLTSIFRVSRNGSRPNSATYDPPLVPGEEYFAASLTRGTVNDLKPQRTISWSVGAKVDPPFVPGLSLSASYYFIRYMDAINSPIGINPQPFFEQFPSLVIIDPTADELRTAAMEVNGGLEALTAGIPNWEDVGQPGGPRIAVLYDARARNLGITRLSGLDFDARYRTETGFGSIDAMLAGNVQLMRKSQANPNVPFVDDLETGASRLRFMASLGANVGKLRAQATLYHTGGYKLSPGANLFGQTRVDAFNTVNLYFKYDVGGDGFGEDLSLTLNLNNVFDAAPPVLRDGGARANGYANGNTVGRLVQFGINKKF